MSAGTGHKRDGYLDHRCVRSGTWACIAGWLEEFSKRTQQFLLFRTGLLEYVALWADACIETKDGFREAVDCAGTARGCLTYCLVEDGRLQA